ncbi:MAG: hypothetical protein ABIG61_13530 [Planctomycetota bacterium]
MKTAVVFAVLLSIALPIMGITITGDSTLKGKLQTFVSYSMSLTSLLLCLLTIVVSTYSLTSDITQKQIFTVVTKPVRRYQLLLGKLLGVVLLDTALLVTFTVIIYCFTIGIRKLTDVPADQIIQADNEFFTARASLVPPVMDVTAEAMEEYHKLQRAGQLPENMTRMQVLSYLKMHKQLEKRAAAPGTEIAWQFDNIKPLGPDDMLFVRFKYDVSVTPIDKSVYSRWYIGDDRQIRLGLARSKAPLYQFDRKDLIKAFHEIVVPGDAVSPDGYLAVVFQNIPQMNNTVVVFPFEDGLEILYKADSFTANYIRAVLLILVRLIFLAALGIFAATWLSFPVAVLICLVVFLIAVMSGFITDSFTFMNITWNNVFDFTVRPLIAFLPKFNQSNPSEYLVPGRLITWSALSRIVAVMIAVKSLILFLVGIVFFSFREIAKITV